LKEKITAVPEIKKNYYNLKKLFQKTTANAQPHTRSERTSEMAIAVDK
jgi:hypothetical protein